MSLSAAVSEQALFDNAIALSSSQTLTGSEKEVADVAIPQASSDLELSVGIGDTSQLKYFGIRNAGTVDLTVKYGASVTAYDLKAGECMALAGPGVAKAVVDALTGTTALASIKVTNGDLSTAGRIQFAVFFDAPIP